MGVRLVRIVAAAVAAGVLVAAAVVGARRERSVVPFANPVAWTYANGTLHVLERRGNRLLALRHEGDNLRLTEARAVEPDDAQHYYMVRALYPGPRGLVVASHVYDRTSDRLVGYRYREYGAVDPAPREILAITLAAAGAAPQFRYAAAPDGSHWFTHNWMGHPCLWHIPATGGLTVNLDQPLPAAVAAVGPVNGPGDCWTGLEVTPAGEPAAVNQRTDHAVLFTVAGERRQEVGTRGFGPGKLLAATTISWASWQVHGTPGVVVASNANRSWVRFDDAGAVSDTFEPLRLYYPFPDIRVDTIHVDADGVPRTFDLANRVAVRLGPAITVTPGYRRAASAAFGWPLGLGAAVALAVLLGAALYGRVHVWRPPLLVKLLAAFVPLLAGVALWVGSRSEAELNRDLTVARLRRTAALATAVANSIDSADLRAIQVPEDRTAPAYARVADTVGRIVDFRHHPDLPKWIVHKIRGDHYYFGIDNWGGPVFEPFYLSNRPEHAIYGRALATGEPQYGRTRDDQGQWFSYLHPIVLPPGTSPDYVIELYEPTEAVDRAQRAARLRTWRLVGAAAVAGALLAWLFTLGLTRPLRRLATAAHLAEGGTLGVRSLDEVDMLAAALDAVRQQRQRAEDLLHVVIPIGRQMALAKEFDRLLETILEHAMQLCVADGGRISLIRAAEAEPECVLSRMPPAGEPATSRLTLPLAEADGKAIGELELVNARQDGQIVPFGPERREMAEALAVLAGAALAGYLRESGLRHEIEELHIAIDELKRDRDVADIVDSDYFQHLAAQAAELRQGMTEP